MVIRALYCKHWFKILLRMLNVVQQQSCHNGSVFDRLYLTKCCGICRRTYDSLAIPSGGQAIRLVTVSWSCCHVLFFSPTRTGFDLESPQPVSRGSFGFRSRTEGELTNNFYFSVQTNCSRMNSSTWIAFAVKSLVVDLTSTVVDSI